MPDPELTEPKRPVKYYVYLSHRKVDMLYRQIPTSVLRRIAGELTIDLPVFKLRIGTGQLEENDYSKLAIVLRYIEREWSVGTVDEPGPYFGGELPLYWGPYHDRGATGFVFFGGRTDTTILGLGGSEEHVIGAKPSRVMHSRSNTPWLVNALLKEAGRHSLFRKARRSEDRRVDREMALQAVEVVVSSMSAFRLPAEMMDFVAVRVMEGQVSKWWRDHGPYLHRARKEKRNHTKVLLGSPLYVALVQ